jgi:hypothetical protein
MTILQILVAVFAIALAFAANNSYVTPGIIRTTVNVILIIICIALVLILTGLTGFTNHKV